MNEPVKYKTDDEIAEEVFGHLPDLPSANVERHRSLDKVKVISLSSSCKKVFAKIPYWIIESGLLTTLTGAVAKVLIAICACVGFENHQTEASNKTFEKISGVKQVGRCLRELKYKSIIETRKVKQIWKGQVKWTRVIVLKFRPPEERLSITAKKCRKYNRDPKTGRFIKSIYTPQNTEKNTVNTGK